MWAVSYNKGATKGKVRWCLNVRMLNISDVEMFISRELAGLKGAFQKNRPGLISGV